MNDIEDRLRDSLHDLAATVPPSTNARADLDRRLAGGPRRRGLLMAAAAAVVVGAVGVPFVMSGGEPVNPPAATASPGPSATVSSELPKPAGTELLNVEFGRFPDPNAALLVRSTGNGEEMCFFEVVPAGQPQPDESCEPVPTWPAKPLGLVITRTVLGEGVPDSGSVPELMLFVVAPQVRELEVRAAYGEPVSVSHVGETTGARFYLAHFKDSAQGFGYTAKDASGAVLEEAIT